MKKENNETPKENNHPILSDMSLKDAVFRCGELQLSFEDTCNLCADKTDPARLMKDLQNSASEAYDWYHGGVSEGRLKLRADLEHNVGDPKAKDAYKSLKTERREQTINKKLDELFGL